MKQSVDGAAAILFAAGLILLFAALFRNASHGGPMLWTGLVVLAVTIGCWFAAARAETTSQG